MHPCLAFGEVSTSLSILSRANTVAHPAAEDEELIEAMLKCFL